MSNLPKFPCGADKKPLVAGGFKAATTDETIIAGWISQFPDCQWGMPTGEASDMFVLDLDVDKITGETVGGSSLAALGIKIPDGTPCVRTPSGGVHYYFHHMPGLRSSANKIGPKIDTRGDGGYVIIPSDGNGYVWQHRADPVQVPTDLLRLIDGAGLRSGAEPDPLVPVVAGDRAAVSPMDLELLVTLERADNTLVSRDDWFAVINAVKHTVVTAQPAAQAVFRQAIIDWSLRWPDAGPDAAKEAARAWDTAKPDGRVKAGTAMHLLRPMLPVGAVPPARDVSGSFGEYLTTFDQTEFFAGCVYIIEDNAILMPDGAILTRDSFSIVKGGHEFQMSADGTRPTRNAWEAFTQNRAYHFPKVTGKTFSPDMPFGTIRDNRVNSFKRESVVVSDAPVDRFLRLLELMLPIESDRQIVLSWWAALVQNPGRKFQWSIVLQGAPGNGKTFLMKCLEYSVGRDVTHMPNAENMDEKYNTYLERNLLIGVEEVHMKGRRDMIDRLKPYITGDRIEIRGMGTDQRMTDNLTNWIFFTNYRDAVLKSKDDRRFAIFFTAQQSAADVERDMGGQFFPELWDWARDGGFAAIAGYISRYAVDAEYDPLGRCHRAPVTSATDAAIAHSRGPVEQEIQEAIDSELPGFCGGWLSTMRVRELLEKRKHHVSNNIVADAIGNLGYEKCKLWDRGRPAKIMTEGNQRITLYCLPEINATATDINDYLREQGYPTALPSVNSLP